jgi:hypothetical protein
VTRERRAAGLVLSLVVALGCAGPRAGQPPGQAPGSTPAAWELERDGALENRGVARVERIGTRWALTVLCDGIHSTYLDDTALDLASFAGRHVRARYRYVDRRNPDTRCVMEPCPPAVERRIHLITVAVIAAGAEAAAASAKTCRTG